MAEALHLMMHGFASILNDAGATLAGSITGGEAPNVRRAVLGGGTAIPPENDDDPIVYQYPISIEYQ